MQSSQRAAFVIPHPYVDALSCFREPIEFLANKGWQVDLYTMLSEEHGIPQFEQKNIRLIHIELRRLSTIVMLGRLIFSRPKYQWIFTVPQWGLHYSSIASSIGNIPMVYISDELIAESENPTPEGKKWKARERKAHQKCAFTIALSKERADFLRKENHLNVSHPMEILPNSPRGHVEKSPSSYYQEKLGLNSQQHILLHSGSLHWKNAQKLMELSKTWSDDWVLVFQVRQKQPQQQEHTHLRFNQTVLPYSMLNQAISSAHIGLALYDDTKINNLLAGQASGKVSHYLKAGLPVIATRQGSFDWLEKAGCGICIDNLEEVTSAANKIHANYSSYAENVKEYYAEHLNFTKNFEPIYRRLVQEN